MDVGSIQLVELDESMEQAYWNYHNIIYGPDVKPRIPELQDIFEIGFAVSVKKLKQSHLTSNTQLGLVPHKTFWLIGDQNVILGSIDLRLELPKQLANFGGNIGYHVHSDYRNQGYATYMLKQMKKIAKEYELTKLLITCDQTNIPSQRVIKKCGGILREIDTVAERTVPIQRWWIEL